MCQVWFHTFSVKSDQGSQRRPKGIAVYVNFSISPSLVITQIKKSLKITFSFDISLLPTFHFLPPPYIFAPISPSSLLFQAISPSSLLCTSPLLSYTSTCWISTVHIPEAWKRYPFWVACPHRPLCGEPPSPNRGPRFLRIYQDL